MSLHLYTFMQYYISNNSQWTCFFFHKHFTRIHCDFFLVSPYLYLGILLTICICYNYGSSMMRVINLARFNMLRINMNYIKCIHDFLLNLSFKTNLNAHMKCGHSFRETQIHNIVPNKFKTYIYIFIQSI